MNINFKLSLITFFGLCIFVFHVNAENKDVEACGIRLTSINKNTAHAGEVIKLTGLWGKKQGDKVPAINDGYLNELVVLKWSNKIITVKIPEHLKAGMHKVGVYCTYQPGIKTYSTYWFDFEVLEKN